MTDRHTDIEALVRAVYGLAAIKREMPRLAGFEHPVGLVPLAVVHRLAPARVKDVAAEMHVDLSVASRHLSALASAGYVAREPDPEDGRAHLLTLTDAGRAALERAHDRIVEAFAGVLAGWSHDDIASLTAALGRLRADYMSATSRPATAREAA